ncbi:MAG TPA: hypothetical protein ACFCUY_12400 [Xenococcaceae cyanobacterium]
MSRLSSSPVNTRVFDMRIAEALGNINAAVIVQQLDYWMQKKEVGVTVKGIKYVYNTFTEWVTQQFTWLSIWQFRQAMNLLRSLEIVRVIRYKSREWNQTNYYSLDYARLFKYLGWKAETIENSELCVTTERGEDIPQLEVRDSELSLIDTKNTSQKETAEAGESEEIAAASFERGLDQEGDRERDINHSEELTASPSQELPQSVSNQKVAIKESSSAQCSMKEIGRNKVINQNWKSLTEELDSIGVPINKTLIGLVKIYSEEEVRGAIALLKLRKREKQIPNPGGYFTAALKGDWASSTGVSEENTDSEEIERGSVFRLWYELARDLGYCSGQEIRDGEQWVCISGTWELWEKAIERGYSVEYLKKVLRRNQGR